MCLDYVTMRLHLRLDDQLLKYVLRRWLSTDYLLRLILIHHHGSQRALPLQGAELPGPEFNSGRVWQPWPMMAEVTSRIGSEDRCAESRSFDPIASNYARRLRFLLDSVPWLRAKHRRRY
jgi:hypothetical protein